MNPWNTLKIQPTDDKKIIKKAYAALLKQYKPDENPEKFQEIQGAYKKALAISQWQTADDSETSSQKTHEENNTQASIPVEVDTHEVQLVDTSVDEEHLKLEQKQQTLIENLYKNLHEMAFAPLAVKDKLENWKFIEDYYLIDDLILKQEVARIVFQKVAEYNVFQLNQNNTLLIQSEVLIYFDVIFDWNSNWNQYQSIFPDHYIKATLDIIDVNSIKLNWFDGVALLLIRCIGFIVDIFISGIFTFIIIEIFFKHINHQSVIVVCSYIVYLVATEYLSKFHLTVGMKYAKLLLLDVFGNTCSKKAVLIRQLILHLNLSPFYLWLTDTIKDGTIFASILLIVLAINTLSFMIYRRLIHDILSKTTVIHM